MTNDERDRLIIETHSGMRTVASQIGDHHRTLYGNGRPGVVARLQRVEEAHAGCAHCQAPARKDRREWIMAIGMLLVSIAAVVAAWMRP